MELKSAIIADIKKGERVYRFEMPVGAPYGECYDAAFEVLKKITQLAKEAADKAEPEEKKDDAAPADQAHAEQPAE